MSIRQYLYISDTKIDTWLPQVPQPSARKITAELGFDLRVLSGKIGTERDAKTAPAERVSKCQVLEKYILSTEEVGSPSSGKLWIAGKAPARVFPFLISVFFVSRLPDATLFLTGSAGHLIGALREADTPKYFPSFGFSVFEMLSRAAEADVMGDTPEDVESRIEATISRVEDPGWVRTLRTLPGATEQPLQSIAFLATRLLPAYNSHGTRYEVYSPLFVERAD